MVFTIGYPEPEVQGVEPKLTRGEINSLAGLRDDPRKFQISTPIQPGNSGGPIVDELGNVLGIVESSLDAGKTFVATGGLPQNVNFAVKISYARVLLETISALKLPSPSVVSPGFDIVVERALSASALVIARELALTVWNSILESQALIIYETLDCLALASIFCRKRHLRDRGHLAPLSKN
jgi:S1-C subfamily serine protease